MARGARTPLPVREEAIQVYAKTGSYAETSRQIKLAEKTVSDVVSNSLEFAEYRALIEKGYIIRTWQRIERIEALVETKLSNSAGFDEVSLLELVTIIEKMHKTVQNVANHIMAIQVNIGGDSDDDIETAAFDYVANKANKSVSQVKELLSIE